MSIQLLITSIFSAPQKNMPSIFLSIAFSIAPEYNDNPNQPIPHITPPRAKSFKMPIFHPFYAL